VAFPAESPVLAHRVSGLLVCEELDSSTALADESIEVEKPFSQFSPIAKEEMRSSAHSSRPEGNVTHVSHSSVAG
jgi:hypothetical protein